MSEKAPTLGAAGWHWLRGLLRREGVFRGSAHALGSFRDLALDYLPSRKRLRYGDIDYDFDHSVNTTWAAPPLSVRLREIFTRGKYQPSEPELFHRILREVKADLSPFVFIDLGSGKGRTLLMASDYPFRRIIGAEIIPELHAIAQQNVTRYRSDAQKCFTIETWLGDARAFPFPPEPLLVYLFNPFPADVLGEVLANVHASFLLNPREILVVYHNLVEEQVFVRARFLHQLQRTEQFAVYKVTH